MQVLKHAILFCHFCHLTHSAVRASYSYAEAQCCDLHEMVSSMSIHVSLSHLSYLSISLSISIHTCTHRSFSRSIVVKLRDGDIHAAVVACVRKCKSVMSVKNVCICVLRDWAIYIPWGGGLGEWEIG